jgi:hypothetical protein
MGDIAAGNMPLLTSGNAVIAPMSPTCRKVLNFDSPVGCTSADGSEKSQYRAKVFGDGREAKR